VWTATISTFLFKFLFSITFLVPVVLFSLTKAIIVSVFWGLFVLSLISYGMAKSKKIHPGRVISEHIAVALIVIAATHFTGNIISKYF